MPQRLSVRKVVANDAFNKANRVHFKVAPYVSTLADTSYQHFFHDEEMMKLSGTHAKTWYATITVYY